MIDHLIETEIKILWVSYPLLIRALKKYGAKKVWTVYLRDWYVDTADKDLKKQKKSARLRSIWGEQFEITIKTKIKQKWYKVRKEENIAVPSLEAGKVMLQMMWLECQWYKEKIRVMYQIGQTKFDIDFYDDMPPVLEIEWEQNEINHWIRKLRLHKHKQVTWGTKKLFKHYGQQVQKLNGGVEKIVM